MKALPYVLATAALGLSLAACRTASREPATEVAARQGSSPISDAFDTEPAAGANYGAGVARDADVLDFGEFLAELRDRDSLTAVVRGEVAEVCQRKGCWMTLASDGEEVTVRFEDYGFFMPKGLAGSEVVAQGTARRRVVPADELRHYAEDAGKSAAEIAAITEPAEEIEFTATGVRVL